MQAETRTLQAVLHGDRRFVVPVYQRPYVWEQDKQWQPLWDDVEATVLRLAEARAEGFNKGLDAAQADRAAAPHFLGAIVVELHPTVTGDVDTRLIVDGQQRLTTIQLLLRGVLDALEVIGAEGPQQAKIRKAIRNDEDVVQGSELLKVTPRLAERESFASSMAPEPPTNDESAFLAARRFFAESALSFLRDPEVIDDPFGSAGVPSNEAIRSSLLVSSLLGLVKLVVIDLETVDDAQVIFEALNARNTPLSATDLVKNLLFLRALAEHHDPEALYRDLWSRFDDESDWWMQQVGTGHAQRARQDWLMGDWLIAEQGRSISVGRLYGEFRSWFDRSGKKAFEALTTLNHYADAYEALHGRSPGASEVERRAFERIERLNITVATPVLLWLLAQPSDVVRQNERELAILAIESYVIRRMAAKWQTRGYGPAFVEVLRAAQVAVNPARGIVDALKEGPHRYQWPTTRDLENAFADGRYYGPGGMSQDRLRLILGEADRVLQAAAWKTEPITIDYGSLQVEHVIPQSWQTHWPVSERGEVARQLAEQERERHINKIGNLTLVTGPLNVGLSNDPWAAKKEELSKHSKLQLNALLIKEPTWDESRIAERGRLLARMVGQVWLGPEDPIWEA